MAAIGYAGNCWPKRIASWARGKKGGRPRSVGPKELAAAKALLADPAIRVEDVAARLKISPATLYRHLPGGRSRLNE